MKNAQGFSLIEVLVTVVLITIGILGMVSLQVKSIQYTQSAIHRNLAVMLSNDLAEIIRSHRNNLFENSSSSDYLYTELKTTTDLYSSGGELKLDSEKCNTNTIAQSLINQAHCWLKAVEISLPGYSIDKIKNNLKLCPSFKKGECASSGYKGSSLELQLSWLEQKGACMDEQDKTICTYITRIEL